MTAYMISATVYIISNGNMDSAVKLSVACLNEQVLPMQKTLTAEVAADKITSNKLLLKFGFNAEKRKPIQ